MRSMKVNGVTIVGKGNVVIRNGRVIVGGNDVTPDSKDIQIEIQGDVDCLEVDACNFIKVSGNVRSLAATSGDVECADVSGSVQTTSGDVTCKNIGGSVQTVSGDVGASSINGSVKTVSGDICRR